MLPSHLLAEGILAQIKMPNKGNNTTCRICKKKMSSPTALRRHKARKLSCSKAAKKQRAEARRQKKNARARVRYYHSLGRNVPPTQQPRQSTPNRPPHVSRPVVMNFYYQYFVNAEPTSSDVLFATVQSE